MKENKIDDNVRISLASDQSHEKVVAEIYKGDKFVALVSNDDGVPIVEIPGVGLDESCISRSMPLQDFQEALNLAVRSLAD
jgi:16S rRNA C1402 (ribose-2'-O) methylase RsmI